MKIKNAEKGAETRGNSQNAYAPVLLTRLLTNLFCKMGEKYSIPVVEGHTPELVYEAAVQYVCSFGQRYEAAYMWFLLNKTQQEIEGKGGLPKWQLNQRKWESYNRTLKQGVLYVLADNTGKKWKKRYCVLQSNYALEVYASKEDFERAGKPQISKKFSGHDLVSCVDSFLMKELEVASRDYGYVGHDLSSYAKKVTMIGQAGKRPTQHIFCASHPWRGITHFAAHTAIEKDQWIGVLKDGIRHLEGVHCSDEVSRDAFTFAIKQTIRMDDFPISNQLLSGAPDEILFDVATVHQTHDCREVVFPKIKGGFVARYKTWQRLETLVYAMMQGIVAKCFTDERRQIEKRCLARRQEIISNLPQLNSAYECAANAIKDVLADCFDPYVTTEIIPKLPTVVCAMSDSLVTPLRATRDLFLSLAEGVQKVVTSQSSEFANNLDRYFLRTLDFAPRDPDFMCPVKNVRSSQKTALDIVEKAFQKTDFTSHLDSICTYQQKLLDSAVCTFETLCGENVAKNDGKLTAAAIARVQSRVIKKLNYDILLAQRRFYRSVLQSGTMELTRESIEESCKLKMLDFESFIPDDLKEFMPISNVFTDVLTKRFNELINPALASCMKQITTDNATMHRFRSSSTLSSASSVASALDEDRGSKNISRISSLHASRDSGGESAPATDNSDCARVEELQDQAASVPAMDGETGEVFKPPQSPTSAPASPSVPTPEPEAPAQNEVAVNGNDLLSGDEEPVFPEQTSTDPVSDGHDALDDNGETSQINADLQTNGLADDAECAAGDVRVGGSEEETGAREAPEEKVLVNGHASKDLHVTHNGIEKADASESACNGHVPTDPPANAVSGGSTCFVETVDDSGEIVSIRVAGNGSADASNSH